MGGVAAGVGERTGVGAGAVDSVGPARDEDATFFERTGKPNVACEPLCTALFVSATSCRCFFFGRSFGSMLPNSLQ